VSQGPQDTRALWFRRSAFPHRAVPSHDNQSARREHRSRFPRHEDHFRSLLRRDQRDEGLTREPGTHRAGFAHVRAAGHVAGSSQRLLLRGQGRGIPGEEDGAAAGQWGSRREFGKEPYEYVLEPPPA